MKSGKLIKLIFNIVIVLMIIFAFFVYKSILSYMLLSLLFVYLVNPIIIQIENIGINKTLSIFIFYGIFFLTLIFVGTIFFPLLIKQISSFAITYSNFISQQNLDLEQLPYIANLQLWFDKLKDLLPFIDLVALKDLLIVRLKDFFDELPNIILSYSSNLIKIFSYLLSLPIISFFLLKDQNKLKKSFYLLIPNRYFELVILIIEKIDNTIGIYLRALFMQSFIIAVLSTSVLTILGIKFGVLIGVLAGILNIIPYLGPLSGIILAGSTVILTGEPISLFMWTVLGMWGVQLIDNAIVYPLIMGKNTDLHPIVIILTVLAGGLTFGVLGMLFGVPVVYLTTGLLSVIYKNLKQFEII